MLFLFINFSLNAIISFFSCASSVIISSFSSVTIISFLDVVTIESVALWNLFINSKIILFLPLIFYDWISLSMSYAILMVYHWSLSFYYIEFMFLLNYKKFSCVILVHILSLFMSSLSLSLSLPLAPSLVFSLLFHRVLFILEWLCLDIQFAVI